MYKFLLPSVYLPPSEALTLESCFKPAVTRRQSTRHTLFRGVTVASPRLSGASNSRAAWTVICFVTNGFGIRAKSVPSTSSIPCEKALAGDRGKEQVYFGTESPAQEQRPRESHQLKRIVIKRFLGPALDWWCVADRPEPCPDKQQQPSMNRPERGSLRRSPVAFGAIASAAYWKAPNEA